SGLLSNTSVLSRDDSRTFSQRHLKREINMIEKIPMGIVRQAPQKERKPWLAHSAFDGPVILFQDVIEVLYRSVLAVRDSSIQAPVQSQTEYLHKQIAW